MVRRRQTQPSLGIRGGLVPGRRSDTKIHRCSSPGREVVSSLHRSCARHPPMRSMPSPDYLQHFTCCKRCINSCSTVFLSSALLLLLYFFFYCFGSQTFSICVDWTHGFGGAGCALLNRVHLKQVMSEHGQDMMNLTLIKWKVYVKLISS